MAGIYGPGLPGNPALGGASTNLGGPTERPAPGAGRISVGGTAGAMPGAGDLNAAQFVAKLVNSGKFAHAQSMLNRLGYRMPIDGIWGGASRAAYKAYMSGVSPSKWMANQHAASSHHSSGGSSGGPNLAAQAAAGAAANSPNIPSASPASIGAPPSIQQILGPLFAALNPQAQATATVNEQFNPLEAQLNADQSKYQAMLGKVPAAVQAAFAPAQASANALAGQDQAATGAATSAVQRAAQALMSLLGPSAGAGVLGGQALNEVGTAQALSGARQGLDNAQAAGLARHVGDVTTQTKGQYQNILSSLDSQMAQEKAQRGAAFTKALSDAMNTRMGLLKDAYGIQAGVENLNLSKALAGEQVTGANLKNQQLAQAIGIQGQQAANQNILQQQQIANQMNQLAMAGKTNWAQLKAPDLAGIEQTMMQAPGILDKNGRLNGSPDQLFNTVVQQYSNLYGDSAQMRNWIGNTINKYMINSRYAGKFRWNNGANKFQKV